MFISPPDIEETALPNGPIQRRVNEVIELYCPSNGSEGECFIGAWCAACERNRQWREAEENPCEILGKTMIFEVTDLEYPTEWIYKNGKPCCTGFIPEGEEVKERCDHTGDMFGDN